MTTGEFADLVARMRSAQRSFFRSHSPSDLAASRRLEKDVDAALAARDKRLADAAQMKLPVG